MPYANTGGGSKMSLTPAQAEAKRRKDAAQKVGKSVPHMLRQAKGGSVEKRGFAQGIKGA